MKLCEVKRKLEDCFLWELVSKGKHPKQQGISGGDRTGWYPRREGGSLFQPEPADFLVSWSHSMSTSKVPSTTIVLAFCSSGCRGDRRKEDKCEGHHSLGEN